jgi:predicted SAM-dependent methyltransferase
MIKLNHGYGFVKREGFVNTDSFPACNPDVLLNIEQFPWTFEDNSFDYLLMKHVLEHIGATFDCFKQVMQGIYRVPAPAGIIEINVPHYRHDTWWSDPTHVRAFTPLTFQMMSRKQNDEWIAKKANYTMLSYVMDVDFELFQVRQVYDPHWASKEEAGEIAKDQLRTFAKEQWNVLRELQILIKAIKP